MLAKGTFSDSNYQKQLRNMLYGNTIRRVGLSSVFDVVGPQASSHQASIRQDGLHEVTGTPLTNGSNFLNH